MQRDSTLYLWKMKKCVSSKFLGTYVHPIIKSSIKHILRKGYIFIINSYRVLQLLCFTHTINITEHISKKENKIHDIIIIRAAKQLKEIQFLIIKIWKKDAIVSPLGSFSLITKRQGWRTSVDITLIYINKLNMKDKNER